MSSLKYIADNDLMTVTLASTYTASSGTMSLTTNHGTRLPSSGDFWLRPTTGTYQCIKVTTRTGDVLTVVGGQDSTTDADIAAGVSLKWVLGSSALDQFRQDLCQTGTDTGKTGEKTGQLHFPSDAIYESRYNGSAWERWGPIWKCTEPALADFAWVNQGTSATADTSHGGIIIYAPANNGDSLRCLVQAAPSPPYVIDATLLITYYPANYFSAGLLFRHSSSGYIHSYGLGYNSAVQLRNVLWSSPTAYSSEYSGALNVYNGLALLHLRIADDNTNRISSYSANGYNYMPQSTVARTHSMAGGPDQVGFFAESNNATYPCYTHLIHWKVS